MVFTSARQWRYLMPIMNYVTYLRNFNSFTSIRFMNEYEKHQKEINYYLVRIDKNITNILEGLGGLSDEVTSLRHDFLEFMDSASESIGEKLANADKHKSDGKNKIK
jgi:hypothetical protein